jgi:uncharacterized protein (DUF58 family)
MRTSAMMPIPSRRSVQALALLAVLSVVALLCRAPLDIVASVAIALLLSGLAWTALDFSRSRKAWRAGPLTVQRKLPRALALGVPTVVQLDITNAGATPWTVNVFDEVDPRFAFEGLPQTTTVPAGAVVHLRYRVTAQQRGPAHFGMVQLRQRTRGASLELRHALGAPQDLRVYPNFAALGRYAWLAGDRRLAQIGIKTYAQRGMGTDFRQLSEYRPGDAIRHIDWKATLRHSKPVVREFQDDRDQCVLFMLDCGRRMRADEGTQTQTQPVHGGSHFDQALNALMLLAYVALKEGDEVGVLTFGNTPGEQRSLAPRKGPASLNTIMNGLYDIEPSAVHSDYTTAARHLARVHHKRALVVMITNFRDEDVGELQASLALLRRQHLVMVASLRERVVREIAAQPLLQPHDAVEVAGAHLFEQSRRDAFRRVVGRDALSIDVEPAQLAVALVNQYHAVKRAGLL